MQNRKHILYLLLLLTSISVVVVSGFIYYNNLLESEKNKAYNNLSAFAELKINQIHYWRKERITDGNIIKNNHLLVSRIYDYLRNSGRTGIKTELVQLFNVFMENREYRDIIIIKKDYSAISLFKNDYKLNSRDSVFLNQASLDKKVILAGIYRDRKTSEISLGTYIPLLLPQTDDVFGFLKIKVDPSTILYPLIESVPTTSETMETFIVRQDGDSVMFLNNLRFKKNAAANFKLPVSGNNISAVMAVTGKVGIYEGFDYKGNEVVAALDKIPDSQWFIVSKINLDEVCESLRTQAAYIVLAVSTLIIICILIAYSLWRNQKLLNLKEQLVNEKALRSSEERFATVFRKSPVAKAIADAETFRTIDVNLAFEKLYGYSREEVIGKTSRDIHLYDEMKNREYVIAQIKMGEPLRDLELDIRRKDGEKRTILLSIELLELDGRKCVLAASQDITHRKITEKALQKSEERFSKAFNSNPNALVLSRVEDGRIMEVNEKFLELFRFEYSEVIGKTSIELDMFSDPEQRISALNLLKRDGRLRNFEIKIKAKDGEEYNALLSTEVLQTDHGESILTILQDISERKRTDLRLQELLNDLKRSNQDLEAFAYSASHDLHEPIRMIKNYSQLILIKEKKHLNNSTLEYLNFIEEGASRMHQLVNDLLQYSRISTTHKEFEMIDCNLLLKDVLSDLRLRINDEKAAIEICDLPVIKGNRTQIRQLFQNLIQNALKFRSERDPEIRIFCELKNKVWLFSVKDNGIGIEEKDFERIFVIFQRLHERDKYPGTGVGLAMCKKIVEKHGGHVCVESEPGRGSIFYFTLPRA